MHVSNIEAKLTEQDLISIVNDFLKVDNLFIENISLDDQIVITGVFKAIIKIKFSVKVELTYAKEKMVKLKINSIKLNRVGVFSIIRNTALKIALNKLAMDGIAYSQKEIVLYLDKLLKDVPYVSFNITSVKIFKGEVVASVQDVNIALGELLKKESKATAEENKGDEEIERVTAHEKQGEAVIAVKKDEEKTDSDEEEEIVGKTEDYYTDIRNVIENKIPDKYAQYSSYALLVPDILALVVRLLKDKRVPVKTKIVLGVCSSYITIPMDFIPDKIPFLGKLDDIGVAIFALTRIMEDVPKEVILANWDGEKSILDIMEGVIGYLNKYTSSGKIDKVYSFIDEIVTN